MVSVVTTFQRSSVALKRLAHGAQRGDIVGGQALHGSDRVPVVAELGLVVVFDDQAVSALGPLDPVGTGYGGRAAVAATWVADPARLVR